MPQSHTPGPWRVGDAGRTVFGPPNGQPSPETVANVRSRENARLIAAAPELLAALQFVLEDGNSELDHEARIILTAALAKARAE